MPTIIHQNDDGSIISSYTYVSQDEKYYKQFIRTLVKRKPRAKPRSRNANPDPTAFDNVFDDKLP